ncbi:MAG: hypothetical protein J0H69_17545 [Burkholderiales bacterium]|nr:hypothetical protein [Burkholderiales bacterium]
MLGAVAEFERMLIRERAVAGQMPAVRRGAIAVLGQPKVVSADQGRKALARWHGEPRPVLGPLLQAYRIVPGRRHGVPPAEQLPCREV